MYGTIANRYLVMATNAKATTTSSTTAVDLDDMDHEDVSSVTSFEGESSAFSMTMVPENREVTHEQHLSLVGPKSTTTTASPSRSLGGSMSRFTNLLRSGSSGSSSHTHSSSRRNARTHIRDLEDNMSLSSDHVANASVANVTVASVDTVKASNRSDHNTGGMNTGSCLPYSLHTSTSSSSNPKNLRKGWNKLKSIMGVNNSHNKTVPEESKHRSSPQRTHSQSEDFVTTTLNSPERKRTVSVDHGSPRLLTRGSSGGDRPPPAVATRSSSDPEERAKLLDQSIRARLDGLDVLSLGPSHIVSLEKQQQDEEEEEPYRLLPWENLPMSTFTGESVRISPAELVSKSLWRSCGREIPEIILEGYIPGCNDRWSVPVDRRTPIVTGSVRVVGRIGGGTNNSVHGSAANGEPPMLSPTETTDTTEDGSPSLPTHQLWPKLWGSQPAPVSVTSLDQLGEDDPLMQMAAEHSIPIDLDENTFIISERGHLDTVHSFAASSLSAGHFGNALLIFNKLLQGVEQPQHDYLRHLKGSTLHNIGVVHMWAGDYEKAVEYFHLAVQERTKVLPKDHPDIAVSMVRKGMAQFALGRYADAFFAMELALATIPEDDYACSRVMNIMGVIHYHERKFMLALREFTSSLEIQRKWLEGSVRRDAVVYDASTNLNNMGKLYLDRGDFDLAYYVYEEALLLQTTIFRKDHDLVLASLMCLALTKARDDQVTKALQILQGCLRSQNTRFGKESAPSINSIGLMGYMYERLDCHEDALKCLTTVKKWQKTHLPATHESLRKTKETIHRIEEVLGKNVSVWV